MRPLIVSATAMEIADSISYLDKHNIPYLITGVGMVATTFALTQYLSKNNCDYIINVGIAGSFDKTIALGEVVEVNKDILSELGAEDNDVFVSIEQLEFGNATYESTINHDYHTELPKHDAITVNTVHGNELSIQRLKNRLPDTIIESMEGAAIFYVANQFNIASLQVRAISNYVEKRNKLNWNIPLAITNLNLWLQDYLDKFIK